jgi:hydroxyquinol 1,2-dioxygenase
MHEPNEFEVTAEVLQRVSSAPDSRIRQISEALVRHLHAFIREIRPTQEEWAAGIRFLTDTGHMCSATRQEFILLSDTLGVSMLVDAINHPNPGGATETTVFGPFYVSPPEFPDGADMGSTFIGPPMWVTGTVQSLQGKPVVGALVDVWHSDSAGFYDLQKLSEHPNYAGRGRFRTDQRGCFRFWTSRPAPYPIPDDGPVGAMLRAQGRHPYRPEHIHFMLQASGYRTLVTHVFARGSAYLDSDVVFGVKSTLIREYEAHEGGMAPDGRDMRGPWYSLHYDFKLQSQER